MQNCLKGLKHQLNAIPDVYTGQQQMKSVKPHTGKCIHPFGGIYAYCRYLIDRNW